MYRNCDLKFGKEPTVYRSTEEIRSDILMIREEIDVITQRLNLRELLVDAVNDKRCGNPKNLIIYLEDALARAEEANIEIELLREELSELEEELVETLCQMGY